MKQNFCISLTLILSIMINTACVKVIDHGSVYEGLKFESELLGHSMNYSLYLPPDYQSNDRRYPVVYLLHGFTDDDTGWIQYGEAPRIADEAIAKGDIPPMIIVMPDGGVTWYTNDYLGKERWQDMFIKEFIPFIDSTYQTRTDKEFRGIGGLSMGGYGALHIALRNPNLFTASVGFSAGVHTQEEIINMSDEKYDEWYVKIFDTSLKGEERITDHWRSFDPISLMKTKPLKDINEVRWYIDCGDDDFLYKGNATLHIVMRDREIPHEFRMRDGAHTWSYWRSGLKDALKFIGEDFHR